MISTLWVYGFGAFPPFRVPEEGGVPCIIPPIDLQKIFDFIGKNFLILLGNLLILLGNWSRKKKLLYKGAISASHFI